MQKQATINDVARIAGVSKRTVSRVINGSLSVGDTTRTRVEKVISELKYSPNAQARGLASSRSYLLGLIYDKSPSLYKKAVEGTPLAAAPAPLVGRLAHCGVCARNNVVPGGRSWRIIR